jgi:hypothetical protein
VPGTYRQPVAAAAVLACFLVLSAAHLRVGGAGATSPAARPAPPTSGEVERATRHFLVSEPSAPAKASGASSGGTGRASKGGRLFPRKRVVALYGAPQLNATILGRKSIRGAKRKLRRQAAAYDRFKRKVVRGFDLVAVIATSDRGPDGKFRTRQRDGVIKRYLDAAHALDARLLLDIQPGRSHFLTEVRALRRWVKKRRVDVALDPEWNVGPDGRPGRDAGSVGARHLNRVSRYIARLVHRRHLPPKLMVVHQFRSGSIRNRSAIEQRHDVQVTLNFDGIGGRQAKASGYARLSRPGLFNGFSLFYTLDDGLMSPREVVGLRPHPDYVLYQ